MKCTTLLSGGVSFPFSLLDESGGTDDSFHVRLSRVPVNQVENQHFVHGFMISLISVLIYLLKKSRNGSLAAIGFEVVMVKHAISRERIFSMVLGIAANVLIRSCNKK